MKTAGRGRRKLACLVLAAAAIFSTGFVHTRMDTSSRVGQGERFVPSPQQAKLSSLGFDAALADYFWIQAMHVVGSERGRIEQHAPLIGRLIEVVTSLDPWVGHPYRFAAVWLTDSVASVRRGNRLLERSIAYHPTDWRNRHYLGFNHFYYLDDDETAADILETAVGLYGAPNYLGPLVAKLRLGAGGLDGAAILMTELVETTENEYAKARYLKTLDEIATERRARFLDAARLEFRKRSGRDITRVVELSRGPGRVLHSLPPAHPHFEGFAWILDPESGQIVSSFYKSRYRLFTQSKEVGRSEGWQAQLAEDGGEG